MAEQTLVDMGGQQLKLTNLTKVLYPLTRTRKSEVIAYYAEIAQVMLPHLAGRPVTRKRWPNGTAAPSFFQKNIDHATPPWMTRQAVAHSEGDTIYPLVDTPAGLAWMGQNAALELHVPQWRFGPDGLPANPDHIVFDLDPGHGVELPDCAVVAKMLRDRLARDGTELFAVTSGAKGIHLYGRALPGETSQDATHRAHEIAAEIERLLPDKVTSRMTKTVRAGRIFIDWSQNSATKTTIAPYSLRGRDRPTVACPRTWAEMDEEDLHHLEFGQVLRRIDRFGDLLAPLRSADEPPTSRAASRESCTAEAGPGQRRESPLEPGSAGPASEGGPVASTPAPAGRETGRVSGGGSAPRHRPPRPQDRPREGPEPGNGPASGEVAGKLAEYRRKRDAAKTPEPVPAADAPAQVAAGRSFVIQEHHARALHWDLRLERHGVLVSWALPKGIPADGRQNRLAVNTEDHPMEYATFSGVIPAGEYGGGRMVIWDRGHYDLEKWRDDEVIVTLHGDRATGRFALIRTRGNQWLMHRTKGQPALPEVVPLTDAELDDRLGTGAKSAAEPAELPTGLMPMLASPGTPDAVSDDRIWRYEGKWDGLRALIRVDGDELVITTRTGRDVTSCYPELAELTGLLNGHRVVLDGEIVVTDESGRSVFNLVQDRMNLSRPAEIQQAMRTRPARFWAFDVLHLDGVSLLDKPFDLRRKVLEAIPLDGVAVSVPSLLEGPVTQALSRTEEWGWEGVVAKRADSVYRPGRRTDAWIKLKHSLHQAAVLAGWTPGAGRRAGTVGALLLAVPDGDGWRYIGKAGTGFADTDLENLRAALTPLARPANASPITGPVPDAVRRVARWVEPVLVGEISHGGFTRDGVVRFPVWRGLRPDLDPADVVIEPTTVGG